MFFCFWHRYLLQLIIDVRYVVKNYLLTNSINIIKNNYPDYTETKLAEIRYGLEAIYLTITKIIVILLLSLILGIFKESILLLLLFNVLRTTGFGIHASKSWMCWVSSLLMFVGIPLLIKYIVLPDFILYLISIISGISLMIFAPADTEKRPLLNKKKRNIYKIITIIFVIAFIVLILFLENIKITQTLMFALLIEAALTNPITYKIFRLPYNNYKRYHNS